MQVEDPEFLDNHDEWKQLFPAGTKFMKDAVVAQVAEQLPCKHQVGSSNLSDSTTSSECGSVADHLLWEQDKAGSIPATPTNDMHPSVRDTSSPFQGVESRVRFPLDAPFNALVAQRLEQSAHNALVAGSNPAEGTTKEDFVNFLLTSRLERIEIYETALKEISAITKVETPMDRSAEAFFMIASRMRKIAIAALKKTGAE